MSLLLQKVLFFCLLIGQNIQNTVKSSSVTSERNKSNEAFYQRLNQSQRICKRPTCFEDTDDIIVSPLPRIKNDENRAKSISLSDYRKLSVLYALINVAGDSDVNEQCHNELEMIQHGVNTKEIWAVKVGQCHEIMFYDTRPNKDNNQSVHAAIDASAKPSSGFIWGNNFWFGSQKGCESLNKPLSLTLASHFPRITKSTLKDAVAPFPMKYFVVHAKHQSPWQFEVKFLEENILQLGLCLPISCEKHEIFNLTQTYFDARQDDFQIFYEMAVDVLEVKDLEVRENFMWKRSVVMLLTILGVTALLHYLSYLLKDNMDIFAESKHDERILAQTSRKERILTSFNIEKNLETIFNSNLERETFPVIGGLKTICSLVIVVFHVQWFKFFTLDNPYIFFHNAEQVHYQWIANAPLLVDFFFVISGFLLGYNYLKNAKQNAQIRENSFFQNVKMFLKLVAKRYVRLTPVYLIVMFLTEIGTSYVADVSIFRIHERTDLTCQRFWWRNMLYIQNFFPHEELCANWTWSTACEMQYFVFFTLIYFIYAKNPKVGKSIFFLAAGSALATASYFTIKHNFQPSFDVLYASGTDLYISSLTRAAPYFVGIMSGYIVMFYRNNQIFNKSQSQIVWCLAVLTFVLCMHSTTFRRPGEFISILTLVFARWLFAFANAWVLIASSLGYGNWFTRFLSHKYFIYFSRTTYSFYLINPLLISMIYGLADAGTHSDTAMGIIVTLGVCFVTYALSLLFSVSFEMPYCKLLNYRAPNKTSSSEKLSAAAAKCD
ncbi:nose resistant to fluoxetine protein 6-like [Culicoides brevitarsis]|uniref:nose resistant to fluoxetine protein 6-like n=1 Tax=Culicoides brevitarsis TaxID=469753 RepID=UPI00307BF3EA